MRILFLPQMNANQRKWAAIGLPSLTVKSSVIYTKLAGLDT